MPKIPKKNEKIKFKDVEHLYDLLRFMSGQWREGKLSKQAKTDYSRMYYMSVYDKTVIDSGLMSEAIFWGETNTDGKLISESEDHFSIPQFCGYMMLEYAAVWLEDEDKFVDMIDFNRTIIKTTKNQNKALSQYSWKKDNLVKCSLFERYARENIKLALVNHGILENQKECFPKPPEGFLEMEKKYIVEA